MSRYRGVANDEETFIIGMVGGSAPVVGADDHRVIVNERKLVVPLVAFRQVRADHLRNRCGPGFVVGFVLAAMIGNRRAEHIQRFAVAAVDKVTIH